MVRGSPVARDRTWTPLGRARGLTRAEVHHSRIHTLPPPVDSEDLHGGKSGRGGKDGRVGWLDLAPRPQLRGLARGVLVDVNDPTQCRLDRFRCSPWRRWATCDSENAMAGITRSWSFRDFATPPEPLVGLRPSGPAGR